MQFRHTDRCPLITGFTAVIYAKSSCKNVDNNIKCEENISGVSYFFDKNFQGGGGGGVWGQKSEQGKFNPMLSKRALFNI